jgi:hypothetical protein
MPESFGVSQGRHQQERQYQPSYASTPHSSAVLERNPAISVSSCFPFSLSSHYQQFFVGLFHIFHFMRFLSCIFEFISFTLCNGTVFILFNFPPLSPRANTAQHMRRGKLVLWTHMHSLMNLTGQTSQTKRLGETLVHNQKMPTKNTDRFGHIYCNQFSRKEEARLLFYCITVSQPH